MADVLKKAEKIKLELTRLIKKTIKEDTKECFRVYPAIVVTAPNKETGICVVKIIGDQTELSLPFSDTVQNADVGDMVLVATVSDSFRNAYVWNMYDYSGQGGGSGAVISVNGKTGIVVLDKSDIGLENVPNVTTNNQTPTFSESGTRNNISSGDTLSTLFGKIKKWFSDLKTVAFTGSYNDLSDKPTIPTPPTVNDGKLTIQKNGTTVAEFTANQSGNTTANISVTDITVDDELSYDSENPVQNKVIAEKLAEKTEPYGAITPEHIPYFGADGTVILDSGIDKDDINGLLTRVGTLEGNGINGEDAYGNGTAIDDLSGRIGTIEGEGVNGVDAFEYGNGTAIYDLNMRKTEPFGPITPEHIPYFGADGTVILDSGIDKDDVALKSDIPISTVEVLVTASFTYDGDERPKLTPAQADTIWNEIVNNRNTVIVKFQPNSYRTIYWTVLSTNQTTGHCVALEFLDGSGNLYVEYYNGDSSMFFQSDIYKFAPSASQTIPA